MDDQQYRMRFGKHVGKSLYELPQDYRAWLTGQRIYADKADLKAALIKGKYLDPIAESEPLPATPTKKRKLSETESAIPPSSAKKLAISQEAKRNGTMLNYDGAAYILDFGKYAGKKLRNVPSTYIDWLVATKVQDKRPDLAAALREGLLVENYTPDTVDPTWRAPTVYEATFMDGRFYDHATQSPLWISDVDASRYFRLGEPLLSQAGVRLVSEADLRRSTEYEELLTFPKGNVRWLYQVYACASRYGSVGATADGSGAVEKAFKDFLGKNKRREREIWVDMGLGFDEGCVVQEGDDESSAGWYFRVYLSRSRLAKDIYSLSIFGFKMAQTHNAHRLSELCPSRSTHSISTHFAFHHPIIQLQELTVNQQLTIQTAASQPQPLDCSHNSHPTNSHNRLQPYLCKK